MPLLNYVTPDDPGFAAQESLDFANTMHSFDPQAASRLAAIHYAWPDLHPQVKVALAQSGLAPDHPAVVAAVNTTRQISAQKKSSGWFGTLSGSLADHVGNFLSDVGDVAHYAVSTASRDIFTGLSTIPEEGWGAVRSIAGDIGGRVGGAVEGAVGGGLAGAAAGGFAGFVGGSEVPILGNIVGAIAGAGTGATVGAVAGGTAGFIGGKDVKGEGGFRLQSSGGIALKHLFTGEPVDLGHGYFPGGGIKTEQQQAQLAAASIGGHVLTPGRVVANSVVEPGTVPYQMLSGLVDFGAQYESLKYDPSFIALGKLGKINSARKTIDTARWAGFAESAKGGELIDALVQEDDPWRIYEASKMQIPITQAKALAAADRPEQVRGILDQIMGLDVTKKFKLQSQMNPVSRILTSNVVRRGMASSNTSAEPLVRNRALMSKFDAIQRIGKMPEAQRIANNNAMMDGLAKLEESYKPITALETPATPFRTNPADLGSPSDAMRRQAGELTLQADAFEAQVKTGQYAAGDVEKARQAIDQARGQASQLMRDAVKEDLARIAPAAEQPVLPGMETGLPTPKVTHTPLDWAGNLLPSVPMYSPMDLLYNPEGITRAVAEKQGIELGNAPVTPTGVRAPLGTDVTGDRVAAQARALTVARENIFPAFDAMLKGMKDVMVAKGVPEAMAERLTKTWNDDMLHLRMHVDDSIVQNAPIPGLLVGGKLVPIPSDTALSELIRGGVDLPDARDVSRELAWHMPMLRLMHADTAYRGAVHLADFVSSKIWNPMVIIRNALALRMGGEEHGRMAAQGMTSFWVHPGSTVAIAGALDKGTALSILGEPLRLTEGAAEAVTGGAKEAFGVGTRRVKFVKKLKPKAGAPFVTAWRDSSLAASRANELHQVIALKGEQGAVDLLTGSSPDGLRLLKTLRGNTADPAALRTIDDVKTFVAREADHVKDITQSDPELLRFVADGKQAVPVEMAAREAITPRLKKMWSEGTTPGLVVADKDIANAGPLDKFVDRMFSALLQRSQNKYTRLVWMNDEYWRTVERNMQELTPAAKATVLENAAKSEKLPLGTMERLEEAAKRPTSSQMVGHELNAEQMDKYAQAAGLASVKDKLYDLGKKGHWADAWRLVFPFAEPWQQSLRHWGNIVSENPQILPRIQQGIAGAKGSGFFYPDPNTGEEMFAYPLSQAITKAVVGAPVKMGASVSSLNMFADNPTYPGFGPLAQIAAHALLGHKPEFDWIMKAIDPTDVAGSKSVIERLAFPAAWMDKAMKITQSPDGDRDFSNTAYEMGQYLISTGKYDIHSQDGMDRVNQTAITMARKMYVLRTLASFNLPAAPQLTYLGADAQGHLHTQIKLGDEYRKLQNEDYSTATAKFMARYGEGALIYAQPKSQGGPPPVEDLYKWARENPQLTRQYPEVFSYFGPHAGQYSASYYDLQIATGERTHLSPEDAERLANHRVAEMIWRTAKDKVGLNPSQAQQDYLNNMKTALLKQFPGFEPIPRDIAKVPRMIEQVKQAAQDPRLEKTPVGESVKIYLLARDSALQAARNAKLQTFTSANSMVGVRTWLRNIGAALVKLHPEFGDLWDQVLSREMKVDEPTVAALPEVTG